MRGSPIYIVFSEQHEDGTDNVLQTEKRDTLIAIEKKYQKKWEEDGVFQADAPSTSEYPLDSIKPADLRAKIPKFFGETTVCRQGHKH